MTTPAVGLPHVNYKPRLPEGYRPGIGVIGCGGIVKNAHLPAYRKAGLTVVGVYDIAPEATAGVQERFGVQHIFGSVEELLSRPDIEIVDIATFPEQRIPLVMAALSAGKHVLAQKPLALDIGLAREAVQEADRRGLKFAVNQNGRWSPPWRVATLLLQQGAIGETLAVTHLFDTHFGWITGSRFDAMRHWCIFDYAIHWFDITRCWLEGKHIAEVRAREYRVPGQPPDSLSDWGIEVDMVCQDGTNALIRSIGGAVTRQGGHPFWLHGTRGTIRGNVLASRPGGDYVELEAGGMACRYDLEGQWFPDAFIGTMGELMCAIAEAREPYHSARHNLLSLQLTLAACRSAEQGGQPVKVEG